LFAAATCRGRPAAAFEGHLSYDWKLRLWFSLDANYWVGGRSIVNGTVNYKSFQNNSRIGATASIPIGKHQSLKFSYSDGAYIVYGGDYQTVSAAWQYSWVGTKLGRLCAFSHAGAEATRPAFQG